MTIPSIADEDDWKIWARKLSVFLSSQEDRGGRPTLPRPVLLAHSTDSASNIGLERNFVEGIMLYDPITKTVILSRDGIWAPLFDAVTVASLFSASSYGSMVVSAPTAGADIPVGSFIPVTEFDSLPVTNRGVILDSGANTIAFEVEGVYIFSFAFSIKHNDVNSGREFSVRLFDITTSTPAITVLVGVARNVGVTNFSINGLIEITDMQLGDTFRIEVGDADTVITDVIWNTLNLSLNMVSEWRGELRAA